MKKITSILCALALVLSVSAAPVKGFQKKTSATKEVKELKARVAADKLAAQSINFAQVAKAPAIRKATSDVTIIGVSSKFYADDNDVYFEMLDADGASYTFDIIVADGLEEVELGKTYTETDMLVKYCGIDSDNDGYYDAKFATATFTKTLDGEGNVLIEATGTDEDGNVWNLHYDEKTAPKAPKGGVFVADDVTKEYNSWYGDIVYTLAVSAENLQFVFDIDVSSIGTDVESGVTYELTDMDEDYSYVLFNGITRIAFASVSFTKTVETDGAYTVEVEAVDANGDSWKVSASKAAPTISTETLKLDGTCEFGSYFSQITAADEDTTVYVSLILWADDVEGAWSDPDDFYAYGTYVMKDDGVNRSFYDMTEIDITVTFDSEKNQYAVAGTMTTANEDDETDVVIYTLDLTIAGPEPEVLPTTLTATDAELEISPVHWSLAGNSDEGWYFAIYGLSNEVAGTYTAADLDDYYTYTTQDGNTYYDMTDANLTVTFESNVITITGTLELTNEADDTDVMTLTVDVQGTYTEPTERHYSYDEDANAFDAEFATVDINDSYFAKYGVLLVSGTDSETGAEISLQVYSATAELAAGVYDIDYSGVAGSVKASSGLDSDGYITGSYATDGASSYWFIVEGTVTVADNGVVTVTGLNSNNLQVTAKIGTDSSTAIKNTNAEVKAVKVIRNGQLIINVNGAEFNVVGARVK